ncbi:MAG: DUF5615 family PIN-like protein [Planctomycetota bacterium]
MTALLLDMGLPRRSAADLRDVGFDADHVGERGLQSATDAEIVEVARAENRIVVTLDRDFSAILALGGLLWPSVIHIRMTSIHRARATSLIRSILAQLPPTTDAGYVATVTAGGIRVRNLPI